jgi:hypothetical protein
MAAPVLPPPTAVDGEIEDLDRAIVDLLERRRALARMLPADRAVGSTFPSAFHVERVVRLYRAHLGGPGELVARAVLNSSRTAHPDHA